MNLTIDHRAERAMGLVAGLLSVLLFTACTSSSELYLEVEGSHVAQTVGVEPSELKFITHGDIVEIPQVDEIEEEQLPMEVAPHEYSLYTKGVIAVSAERIFWAHEEVGNIEPEDFLSVPLIEIQAIQRVPDNALLVRTKSQDIILRPHSWTKYAGDEDRLNMLRTALMDEGVKVVFTLEEIEQVTPRALDPRIAEQERSPFGHPLDLPGELKLP